MSFQIWWKWLRNIAIFSCLLTIGNLPPALGQDSNFQNPWRLLEEKHDQILQLSSDQEALEFNQRFMPQLQQSQQHSTRRKQARNKDSSDAITPERQTIITTFLAAMATIANIQKFRAVLDTPWDSNFFSKNLPSATQREWILSKPALENFTYFLDFQHKVSMALPREPIAPLPPDNDYAPFTHFHDQARSTMDSFSWTNLLNDRGLKGIEDKLHEYWPQKDQPARHPISDSQKQIYIQQYIASRLLPIFHAYLLTQAIESQAQAYHVAWESWHHIQQWQQQEQDKQARMRLCGNWKWIIHNHQNHGDHKTTMTFHSPDLATPSQVQPTTIFIHGDTVYLKWTFPQGTQEDSLLLTNRDTRLEGTFTNSLGPHGSISGKRLSPCQN
jgi:hypothetical protein